MHTNLFVGTNGSTLIAEEVNKGWSDDLIFTYKR